MPSPNDKLRDLANHLRHCIECHKTDVLRCHEGQLLWIDAGMPYETETLVRFANSRLGCRECGGYWKREVGGVLHALDCSVATQSETGDEHGV